MGGGESLRQFFGQSMGRTEKGEGALNANRNDPSDLTLKILEQGSVGLLNG